MRYEAYIDGSYKKDRATGIELYAGASIIAPEGTSDWTILTQVGSDATYLSMNNVAGELVAALQVFGYCIDTLKMQQGDLLRLNYDYVGIENWLRPVGHPDYWRQKKPATQAYRSYYMNKVAPRFKVEFRHTPGHTGVLGNEIVDKLAKEAIAKRLAEVNFGG